MEEAIKIFRILETTIGILGLIWILVGVIEFLGGRNTHDAMRQERGTSFIVNGAVVGGIAVTIGEAVIALLKSIQ